MNDPGPQQCTCLDGTLYAQSFWGKDLKIKEIQIKVDSNELNKS